MCADHKLKIHWLDEPITQRDLQIYRYGKLEALCA